MSSQTTATAQPPPTVITVQGVTKSYRLYDRHIDRVKEVFHPLNKKYHRIFNALTDVDLRIHRGETVGIIGRNGSGKSTLLQVICGILKPSSGKVHVNGRISALLELGAGFNPEFTGRENVYINAGILGLSREQIDSRFRAIEAFADIGVFIDQPVKTYSSGMYVRLAFAVAINVNPDVLVVDEALSVGDTLFQSKCFAKFQEFQESGVTIIFVTHSLDLVTRYCNVAHLMEGGRLVHSGRPKAVVDEYNRMIVNCSPKETTEDTVKRQPCTPPDAIAGIVPERQWEGLFQLNPQENRYGNGKAEIVEAGIFELDGSPVQTLLHGEQYEFRLKVKFKETLKNPIYAYTIKDIKGFDIAGTNTLYRNIDTEACRPDGVTLATFTHRICLNPGGYLLSFGCAGFEDGEYVVYERRYDYLIFDVVSHRASVGIFDMDSAISVSLIGET